MVQYARAYREARTVASGDRVDWGWRAQGGLTGGDSQPPAGWLPDPTGRFQRRYWSGDRWTPRVRAGDAEAIDRHGVPGDETTGAADSGVPGSWYPDPTGRFEQRLLNGQRWTRLVRVGEAVAVDVLGVPNTVGLPKNVERPRAGTSTSPPGWRPDPDDSATERYWDGFQWTAARRPAGSRGTDARSWAGSWLPRRVLVAGIVIATLALTLLVLLGVWLAGVLG